MGRLGLDGWRVAGCLAVLTSVAIAVFTFMRAVKAMADVLGPRRDA